jgi:hypothetical protein
VVASKKTRLYVNGDKSSTWSCFEIRMQNDVKRYRLIIVPSKGLEMIKILERI